MSSVATAPIPSQDGRPAEPALRLVLGGLMLVLFLAALDLRDAAGPRDRARPASTAR